MKFKNFILYVLSASIISIVNILIYLLLSKYLIKNIFFSNLIAYTFSITLSFIVNKKYIFKSKNKEVHKEASKFLLVKLLSFLIDTLVLYLCINVFSLSNTLSKIISNSSTAINNYFLNKYFVFKKRKNTND